MDPSGFFDSIARMSWFEVGMLICFGAGWPFSVWKQWKTKTSAGKSLLFLVLVLIGYLLGAIHKLLYSPDVVIVLYLVNFLLVFVDLCLCFRYQPRPQATPVVPKMHTEIHPARHPSLESHPSLHPAHEAVDRPNETRKKHRRKNEGG